MKIIKVVFFLFTFFALERFCHKQTEGFSVRKISPWNTADSAWETEQMDPETLQLLDQPFHFLGSGGQCYAFVSQDKKYVIKFFKLHHMRPLPSFIEKLHVKFFNSRQERCQQIFDSCLIVNRYFKDKTATLHVHINPTNYINKKLTILDTMGIAHTISLDTTPFVLQKWADLAYPVIKKFIKNNRYEEARACIRSLISLMQTRSDRGIADKDPIIKRNFGFIGTDAIEIDIGSFSINTHLQKSYAAKRNLLYEIEQLQRWLRKRDPKGFAILQEELSQLISNS